MFQCIVESSIVQTQDYEDEATRTKTHVFSTKTQVLIQVQFVPQELSMHRH